MDRIHPTSHITGGRASDAPYDPGTESRRPVHVPCYAAPYLRSYSCLTAGPTETYPGPAITVDVEKNVRSAILYLQVNNGGQPSLTGSQFFCGCVSACANEVRGIRHDNFFLHKGQLGGSFEILFPGNHL